MTIFLPIKKYFTLRPYPSLPSLFLLALIWVFFCHLSIQCWDILQTRHEGLFSSELKQRLLLTQNESAQLGTRYNVPLINSLVLYVGMQVMLLFCLAGCTTLLSASSPQILFLFPILGSIFVFNSAVTVQNNIDLFINQVVSSPQLDLSILEPTSIYICVCV